MNTVLIKGDNGYVSIDVLGYENEAASNDSDANWLSCIVEVRAGPFAGRFQAAVTTGDFAAFEEQLNGLLRNSMDKARFETDEDCIRFEITTNSRGAVKISGTAKSLNTDAATLSFTLQSDQSALVGVMAAVRSTIDSFPARHRD